jgi:hypothetical protein
MALFKRLALASGIADRGITQVAITVLQLHAHRFGRSGCLAAGHRLRLGPNLHLGKVVDVCKRLLAVAGILLLGNESGIDPGHENFSFRLLEAIEDAARWIAGNRSPDQPIVDEVGQDLGEVGCS